MAFDDRSKTSIRRILWGIAGVGSVILGAIGAVLPLLPTTPFLLLAAFCFSQSSERLHNWLMEHPRLSPPIKAWQRHGAISRKAKVLAGIAMLATVLISFWVGVPTYVLLIQLVVLLGVSCFIFTRPSPPNI